MKKFLLCYAVLTTALLVCACRSCRHARGESRRLADNQTALASEVERYRTRLGDTLVPRRAAAPAWDTLRRFRWRDPWVTVEGSIGRDSAECRIRSVDTLRQVVHRVPRRFLFIRWGTKALRQQIVSSNPHTRIVYTEYVRIER